MHYLIGLLLAALTLAAAGCGGDDENASSGAGNAADRAFQASSPLRTPSTRS